MAISERPEKAVPSDVSPWVGQRMTLDEFLVLPDEGPSLEYEDGVVTQKVAAKPVHGSFQSFLVRTLDQIARRQRLGLVLPETRFVTPTGHRCQTCSSIGVNGSASAVHQTTSPIHLTSPLRSSRRSSVSRC